MYEYYNGYNGGSPHHSNPMAEHWSQQRRNLEQQISPYSEMPQKRPQFIARQVTSIEEARACPIDALDTNIFINHGTSEIYVKKMRDDGTAPLEIYKCDQLDKLDQKRHDYRKTIEAHGEQIGAMQAEIEFLKEELKNANSAITESTKSKPRPNATAKSDGSKRPPLE